MIIGVSAAIQRAKALVEKYARTRLPILLVGPTGTGKDLFAHHIHQASGRRGPLVDVNCFVLPRDVADSLLFGHVRGAFTGAVTQATGHFDRASGGTLFLDELGSLAPEAQGKILRVLETGEVQPIGSGAKRPIDLRVVSAAQAGIEEAIRTGAFRLDLYQRVAGVVIELPPLGARLEDVVPLADFFASLQGRRLTADAEKELTSYSWPGNVRELRFAIERAGALVENGVLPGSAIAQAIRLGLTSESTLPRDFPRLRVHRFSRERLVAVCEEHRGEWRSIAATLGIRHSALYERLRSEGLTLRAFRFSGDRPPEGCRKTGLEGGPPSLRH